MASAVFAFLFILSRGESSFPKIPVGTYFGKLVGVFDEHENEISFIFESHGGYYEIYVLKPGWSKIYIQQADYKDGEFRSPLEFSAQEAHLRLSGVRSSADNSFSGDVYNLGLGLRGNWSMAPHALPFLARSNQERQQTIAGISLNRELDGVEREIFRIQGQLKDSKEAVARLSEFLSDAETMNERAAAKFERVQREFELASQNLKLKRKEARELAQRLSLSESVTDAGLLVALSRKTLDRESRWLDSIFNSAGSYSSYDLEQEVTRAKRIIALKKELLSFRRP